MLKKAVEERDEARRQLEDAKQVAIECFCKEELPRQLDLARAEGAKDFALTPLGKAYIEREWAGGLLEYRETMLYYHPEVDARVCDRHFPQGTPAQSQLSSLIW